MIEAAWLALRAAGFVLLLQAVGAVLFLVAFRTRLGADAAALRRYARLSAAAACGVSVLQCGLEAAHMAGEWSGITDLSLLRLLTVSSAGRSLLVRVAALAAVAAGLTRGGAAAAAVALTGSALALLSFLLTGHTAVSPARAVLAPLLLLHLAVVAFWFGSLRPLRRLAAIQPPQEAARPIAAFSAVAVWLVPLIPLAGAGIAALLLPGVQALWTPYGRLLLVKLGLFALLMLLAALNRLRYVPALSRGEGAAGAGFRRSVLLEWYLIAATLGVTAALTGLYAPGHHGMNEMAALTAPA